jgi:hypothetical protein
MSNSRNEEPKGNEDCVLDDAQLSEVTGGAELIVISRQPRPLPFNFDETSLPTLQSLGNFELPEIRPLPLPGVDGTRAAEVGKVGGGKGGGGIGVKF